MQRSTSRTVLALLCSLAGGLAGCGDTRTPSKNAFASALGPVVRDVFCHPIDVMPYEIEGLSGAEAFPIVTSTRRELAGPGSDGRSVAMLDALAGVGLVSRTEIERPARWKGSDRPFVRQPLVSYEPTDRGASYLRAVERKATDRMVSVPSICIAKGEVVDVVRWSEPVDFSGRRVSQVTYTYRGVDPIPVMPKPEQVEMARPKDATTPFELQSDGWRPAVR